MPLLKCTQKISLKKEKKKEEPEVREISEAEFRGCELGCRKVKFSSGQSFRIRVNLFITGFKTKRAALISLCYTQN